MTTNTSPAPTVADWLKIAPETPLGIVGTIPSGSAGGNVANVSWQQTLAAEPAYITRADYYVSMTIELTLPANGSATFSPYAPYSLFNQQYSIGGTTPWSALSMLAFYLDDNRFTVNTDENYPGLGDNSGFFANILDLGSFSTVLGGAGSLTPGQTVTNSTTAPVTNTYTFSFVLPQRLQRRMSNLWGAIPLGDASYEVVNQLQLNPLVGTDPTLAAFINATSGTTATTGSQTTVTAIYTTRSLNSSVQVSNAALPKPSVGFGMQINQNKRSITTGGAWLYSAHTTGMLYTYIAEVFVNDGSPVQMSGMAIGPTQKIQGARTIYEDTQNTLNLYWTRYHRVHGRYPLDGVIEWDLERGDYPPIVSVTPFVGYMTPNDVYSGLFGVPATPAMATFYKPGSNLTLTNASVWDYTYGLVEVGY